MPSYRHNLLEFSFTSEYGGGERIIINHRFWKCHPPLPLQRGDDELATTVQVVTTVVVVAAAAVVVVVVAVVVEIEVRTPRVTIEEDIRFEYLARIALLVLLLLLLSMVEDGHLLHLPEVLR